MGTKFVALTVKPQAGDDPLLLRSFLIAVWNTGAKGSVVYMPILIRFDEGDNGSR